MIARSLSRRNARDKERRSQGVSKGETMTTSRVPDSSPAQSDLAAPPPRPWGLPKTWSRQYGLAALLGAGLLVIALALGVSMLNRDPEGLVFVIPAGAKARVARPTIDSAIAIPTDIRFAADEPAVITIRNLDDVAHRAGPFLVDAGQTYTQRFPGPGRYPIACSVNPLESIVVTVEE